jgi:hypothetical protein
MYQLALSLHRCAQGALVLQLAGRCSISHRVLSQVSLSLQLGGDGLQVLGAAHAIPVGEELISTSAEGSGKDQARIFAGMQIARI